MTTIPGLGGHNPQLQRALMDAVDKALAEEVELLADGTGGAPTTQAEGAAGARRTPRATVPGQPRPMPAGIPLAGGGEDAIIVELSAQAKTVAKAAPTPGDAGRAGRADRAGGEAGRTAEPRPTPGATGRPGAVGQDPVSEPVSSTAAPTRQASTPAAQVKGLPLDQLVAVLKRSGTDFKQALKVLQNIELDQPLPTKAVLKALWSEAPADRRTEAAGTDRPAPVPLPRAEAQPIAPSRPLPQPPRQIMDAPLDQLVRDRAWHRANPIEGAAAATGASAVDEPTPTLTTIVTPQPHHQLYVAGLTTAEYQRLAVLLGDDVPEWFGEVRGSRGLRALIEHRGFARLTATRLAGVRVGGWTLGAGGMAIAWVAGIRYGAWW